MIPDDDCLMPDVKLVNNYLALLEFVATRLASDCNLSLMGSDFYTKLLSVQDSVRELRLSYFESLKFKSYE